MKRPIITAVVSISMILFCACGSGNGNSSKPDGGDSVVVPSFNEDSAMLSIRRQCSFGPRTLGSEAHAQCADYIERAFREQGLEVSRQQAEFTLYNGEKYPGCNIIARYNAPAASQSAEAERIMICAHWDSRPWADNDPDEKNHHSPVPAANDGASGVAVMIELARQLKMKAAPVSVDFVCFDAEDAGVPEWETAFQGEDEDTWCLGSQYWARNPHTTGLRFAILLDMVGGTDGRFYKEGFSRTLAPAVQTLVWQCAAEAGYASMFPNEDGGYITDDHIPVNRIAHIPCVDVIAYNINGASGFPSTWHTLNDTPDHISPSTLKAVGQTMMQVIYGY